MANIEDIQKLLCDELEKFRLQVIGEIKKELIPQIQLLKDENNLLKQKVSSLEEKVKIVEENSNNQEQYSKQNEVILSGIPPQKDEDIFAVVKCVFEKNEMN